MGLKWDIEKFTGDNDFGLWKVKMEAMLIQQKCVKALKGEGTLPVTSRDDRDGGQGQECHCLVPQGYCFERSSEGTNRDINVVKVRVFVHDKVFGSSVIPKATTFLIQDGGVKGHHRATCGVQQNP